MFKILRSLLITNIFNYKGYSTNKEYAFSFLYSILLTLPFLFIPVQSVFGMILALYGMWVFVAFISLTVRRLRDAGKSFVWMLFIYSPIIAASFGSNTYIGQTIAAISVIPWGIAIFFLFLAPSKERNLD